MNDPLDSFVAGVLATLLFMLGLFIGTPVLDKVRVAEWEVAEKYCAPHDGVWEVYRPHYRTAESLAVCKNGVKVVVEYQGN